jgi:hypothetical protein
MASRRIGRALAAFGQSLGSIADKEIQNKLYMERQAEESRLIGERQRADDERTNIANLTEKLRAGLVQPQQLTDRDRKGITGSANGNIMQLAPPEASVIGPIAAELRKVTESGQVPRPEELMQQRLASGKPFNQQEGLSGIANLINTAGATRERLQNSEAFNRDAEAADAFNKEYNTGMAKEQVAKETEAAALARRKGEKEQDLTYAGRTRAAENDADFRAKIKYAPDLLKLDVARAVEMNRLDIDKARQIAGFTAISKASENSTQAIPRINNLSTLWQKAQPEIKGSMTNKFLGPAFYDAWATRTYMGMPTNTRRYFQELDASLPFLARLTGEVGNLADQEQMRQRYGAPTAYDAAQGTGLDKLENLLAFGLSAPTLARMNNDPAIINLAPDVKLKMIEDVVQDARNKLKAQRKTGPKTGDEASERAALEQALRGAK